MAQEYLGEGFACKKDPLGSFVATRNGGGDLLLEAHLDEICLIVTAFAGGSFLRCAAVGSIDPRVLRAARLKLHAAEKTMDVTFGSVPPHLQKGKEERLPDAQEILLDTGLSEETLRELVHPGDTVTFDAPLCRLASDRVSAKALDDRAGCAAVLTAAKEIAEQSPDAAFTVQLSALEESGAAAAACGVFAGEFSRVLCVDVSFANTHGERSYECGVLGKGPMIGLSPVLSREMREQLTALAQKNEIPFQLEIMAGRTGTDADRIAMTRGGISTALLSIPLRNMHTPVEIISLSDLHNTARLMSVYAQEVCHA